MPLQRESAGRARSSGFGEMDFYRVLDFLPSRWRSFFVTLAVTGLRLEDLCELQAESLDYEWRAIRMKDSKSPTGVRTIYVAHVLT
jgi:integrase